MDKRSCKIFRLFSNIQIFIFITMQGRLQWCSNGVYHQSIKMLGHTPSETDSIVAHALDKSFFGQLEVAFMQPFVYMYCACVGKNFRINIEFCLKGIFWRRAQIKNLLLFFRSGPGIKVALLVHQNFAKIIQFFELSIHSYNITTYSEKQATRYAEEITRGFHYDIEFMGLWDFSFEII